MRSTRQRDSDKPDLQFTLGYPSETDKLRLRSGTVLQREVTERERRRLDRERKREKELALKSQRVTSSSETMDTDEAGKHTRSILNRINEQQEERDEVTPRLVEISSSKLADGSSENTLEDSDPEATILEKIAISQGLSGVTRQKERLEEPSGGVGYEKQQSLTRTLRYGTPPPVLGITPTTTKLTFGLSQSLENMTLNLGSTMSVHRPDLGTGYTNNEFYLPIAGCPSVSELEPQLTDQLTLKGNRAKLLHVPLWSHVYYTSSYLIDDITGELYACHQGELIAIKEQGYLQKDLAEEAYLVGQVGKDTKWKETFLSEIPKLPQPVKSEAEKDANNRATLQDDLAEPVQKFVPQEHPDDVHRQAVAQWNLKRRERKQLEGNLLKYKVKEASGRNPTDQEIEKARMYLKEEHMKKLREELPYICHYFETIPTNADIEDNDGVSESSAGSYEACEEWTEEGYRKLMINFNRNEAQYAVERQVKELAIQRDPENTAEIEKEYSRNRERLDYRQKRGQDLLKVAKPYADYTRRQQNLREKIRQEELEKLQSQRVSQTDAQWKSQEEELRQEISQHKNQLHEKGVNGPSVSENRLNCLSSWKKNTEI